MTKSDKTYDLEDTIAMIAGRRTGRYGCAEVGLDDEGIVDYVSIEVASPQILRCYELKITKSDFQSSAKKTFVGDFNYYVIPIELWTYVRNLIEPGIGCWCIYKDGNAVCKREPERMPCRISRKRAMTCILQALSRENMKEVVKRTSSVTKRREPETREEMLDAVVRFDAFMGRHGMFDVDIEGEGRADYMSVEPHGKKRVKGITVLLDETDIAGISVSNTYGEYRYLAVPRSLASFAVMKAPSGVGVIAISTTYGSGAIVKRPRRFVLSRPKGFYMAMVLKALSRGEDRRRYKSWLARRSKLPVKDISGAELHVNDIILAHDKYYRIDKIKRLETFLSAPAVLECSSKNGEKVEFESKIVRLVQSKV